jgi:HEAT repeat protein
LLRTTGPTRQSSAALFFREHPVNAPKIVPLLRTCLTSTNASLVEQCALALGAYGSAAREALPELTTLSRTPKVRVSSAALNAISAIEEAVQAASL